VGIGAGMVAVAVAAAPALAAEAEIHVKDTQVPTQAKSFDTGEDCDAAGVIPSGYDAWHLILPGNEYNFEQVTGEFAATEDGPIIFTAVAPGPYGVLPDNGNSGGKHAYLFAPAGLWLIDATATISGEGDQPKEFVISHTCPGTPTSPSPSTSPSDSPSPSTSLSPSTPTSSEPSTPSESTSPEPSESTLPTSSSSAGPAVPDGGGGDDELPTTGAALAGVLGAGLLLLGGGVALVVLARRRIARG
jgi:hypothetical protein